MHHQRENRGPALGRGFVHFEGPTDGKALSAATSFGHEW